MALAGVSAPDRQPSPNSGSGMLSSNNPFRNRASSPVPPPPRQTGSSRPVPPPSAMPSSAVSRNPFLDASETAVLPVKSGSSTADIFKDLSLLDKPAGNGPSNMPPPARAGTLPPPMGHRPSASDERRRGPPSPNKRDQKSRPRGMSESSTMEKDRRDYREREQGERTERTESEDRRRRERRKDREERHKREKERIRNGGRPAKTQRGLDIIDKLDVTGIYGQGLFHHDGPFDACNPHRNARKDRKAPMQAFPEGSANMALGGSGPLRSRIDLDKFHGRGEEGFTDFAVTRKPDTAIVINAKDAVDQVHGEESYGLGTSTFLEGAPASRAALQRRESADVSGPAAEGGAAMGGGLTRKKSLAQRFRGMSASRPTRPRDLRSPDARYGNGNETPFDSSPPPVGGGSKAVSAGGPMRAKYTKENEINPFDEYDHAFDKKGAQIRVAESSGGRVQMPGESSTGAKGFGLVRSVTTDSSAIRASDEAERTPAGGSGGGGFLNRMKSLKGGRRTRVERRDT